MNIIKKKEFKDGRERICLIIYKDELEIVDGHKELFYLITETTVYPFPEPPHNMRYLGMSDRLSYAVCDAVKTDDPGFITEEHISFFREVVFEFLQNDSHKKEIELKLEYLEKYIKLPELDIDEILSNSGEVKEGF